MNVSTFIVSKDPPSIAALTRLVKRTSGVHLSGHSADGATAFSKIIAGQLDANMLLLDIDTSGLDYQSLCRQIPAHIPFVFVTSVTSHAADAYALGAADYLLKPVNAERFLKALQKVRLQLSATADRAVPADIMIKTRAGCYERVVLSQLVWIEVYDKHLSLYCMDRSTRLVITRSMTDLEKELPPVMFMRIHKSYIVNLNYIKGLAHHAVQLTTGTTLHVGRNYAEELYRRLNIS
ncbi:LytR/AlgR family response regulator transcription factor [Niabella sp. CJ426]|uniref:LytR/AlgR family response regulator transcription factor n=1 Tax=Niabella sp. CJ426 TaxID=3393740 RepID=UPI003D07BFDA